MEGQRVYQEYCMEYSEDLLSTGNVTLLMTSREFNKHSLVSAALTLRQNLDNFLMNCNRHIVILIIFVR